MNVQDVHSRSGGHGVDVARGNFKESRILSLNIVHGSVLQIFWKEPFFYGHDNHDQPVKIAKVLGTDGLNAYLKKYHIELDPHLEHLVGRHNRKPWSKFINADKRRQAAWM